MFSLAALLVIVSLSILITRVATTALTLTGLSAEAARFQARSALSGTGFTTDEAEQVVTHPVRRRIVTILMILQNAGVVTAVSTLILSFIETGSSAEVLRRALILAIGLGVLMYLASSDWVDYHLSRIIEWSLNRYTELEVADYYSLLHLSEGYTVGRIQVQEDSWLAGQKIEDLKLPDEGILILSVIRRDESYVGTPRGRYIIHPGDTLIVYGDEDGLARLKERTGGQQGETAHQQAEEEHRQNLRRQDQQQRVYQRMRDREYEQQTR